MTLLYTEMPKADEMFADKYRLVLDEITKKVSLKLIEENIDVKLLANEIHVSVDDILSCIKGEDYKYHVLTRLASILQCDFLEDVHINYIPKNKENN